MWGDLTGATCKFCVRVGNQVVCALYDEELQESGEFVRKTLACKRMTAGFKAEIITDDALYDPTPPVEPKKLMAESIRMYERTVKQLMRQGLNFTMASNLAKKQLL